MHYYTIELNVNVYNTHPELYAWGGGPEKGSIKGGWGTLTVEGVLILVWGSRATSSLPRVVTPRPQCESCRPRLKDLLTKRPGVVSKRVVQKSLMGEVRSV